MSFPSTDPAVDVYPVQFEAVMDNGIVWFQENAPQSAVRGLPRPVRQLRIRSPGWQIPFVITIPVGAKPKVFQVATTCRTSGCDPEPTGKPFDLPREYWFGWEKEIEGKRHCSAWQFTTTKPVQQHEWVE